MRLRARADTDRDATRRRLHRQRCARRWNDPDGMGKLLLAMPAEDLRELDATLQTGLDRRLADARAAGRFEAPEAYLADEIMDRLLGRDPHPTDSDSDHGSGEGDGSGGGGSPVPVMRGNQAVRPEKKVIVLIDIEALHRGRVEGDETCEIAGVGPVSVTAAQRLMGDAFWAVVIKDGVDIKHITHLGRRVTTHQRSALEARGGRCEFCHSLFRVEIDHILGWSLTHQTHTTTHPTGVPRDPHGPEVHRRARSSGPRVGSPGRDSSSGLRLHSDAGLGSRATCRATVRVGDQPP